MSSAPLSSRRPHAHLLLIPLILLAAVLLRAPAAAAAESRPNIVVVLCDDLGYGDLACYGNDELQTPHVDRFAAEGLKLTSCYAAHPNCSPSRTGMMTGRTPYRVGVHDWIPFLSPVHVRESEITVATLLKNAGYETCHVGKWHLNGWFNLPGQPQPNDHGFDHWFATQNNALPNHRNPYNFVRNGIPVGPQEGYAAHLVVDEAEWWLTEGRGGEKPFFLFVCFHEPHEPIATDEEYTELYPSDDPSYSAHHGNITQMDAAFGRLMKTLDEQGLRENTLVFFTSDNGPAITSIHPHGSSGPLRHKKGHMYEGGIRVPGIVRWPGRTKAGTVSDEPVSGVDLLPTACDIVGIDPPQDRTLDGASFLPVLEGKPIKRTQPLYWHFNFASSEPKVAIREGDWKLLAMLDDPGKRQNGASITEDQMQAMKTAEPVRFELYNLKDDIGETTDLSTSQPERLEAMKQKLLAIYHDVREESPTWPEWEFPRYEGKRIEWPAYRKRR
ncbi:Arylsulfatase [Maioricimonas rarisocia]|uniref:Arylsulfatase n=1 Tax=Maioricimonas rarisocia TaxID=2528026 RepID=A0A517ZFR5_9PLAN|nr:sulfatase [Maioricimonas rarisocia]QDU41333.1 Arylsulfatase [Maioricimonas rarisocia]